MFAAYFINLVNFLMYCKYELHLFRDFFDHPHFYGYLNLKRIINDKTIKLPLKTPLYVTSKEGSDTCLWLEW